MNYTRERIKIAEISLQRRHLKAKILPLTFTVKSTGLSATSNFLILRGGWGLLVSEEDQRNSASHREHKSRRPCQL